MNQPKAQPKRKSTLNQLKPWLVGLFVFSLLSVAGCAPPQKTAVTTETSSGVNESPQLGRSIRVLGVQQFDDKMPIATEDGHGSRSRLITVVQFEVKDCDMDFDREHFELKVSHRAGAAVLRIESTGDNCVEGSSHPVKVSTTQVAKGESIIVVNPALVEQLTPTN